MAEAAQRAILHVDMDAFYASVEMHDDPSLAGQPVIVGGLGPRGVVSAANYPARRYGVHSAMPITQARRLCSHAHFLRPRMDRYREVSAEVFRVFHDVTPLVEGLSLDEAFLDVTASLRLFGSREAIGRRIVDGILERTGLQASVGMAHNKFLAKLASDVQKPAGFVSVDADRVRAFLDPMPIGRLWGIGRKTEPRLKQMGLLTIGQLRQADSAVLRSVLGNRTGHFLRLARGEDERPVVPQREDKSMSSEVTFDKDVDSVRELKAELLHQAEGVARRLRRHHFVARTVVLKIRDGRFRTATRRLTLREPTDSTRAVYQVGRGLLSRWLESHANTPVRLIGVGVTGLENAPSERRAAPGGLDSVVDAITGKFGDGTVTHGLALERQAKPGVKR